MARQLFEKTQRKVVPFEQNGQFYHRKAKKHIENNNYVNALNFYRKAVEKEPGNVEYLLDLAETFTEMGYFDESNKILFTVLQKEKKRIDCYFGLGCNFLGLQEYDKAEDCLEKYLIMDPEGIYYEDAMDLLDVLNNYDYYMDDMGMGDPAIEHTFKLASKGKEYLDKGDYEKAIKQLEKVINREPSFIFAKNNLALAYFCSGKLDEAIEISREVLQEEPRNVHANCNICLFLSEKGEEEEGKAVLRTILDIIPEDPEEIHKITVTLCELGEHEKANKSLKKLLQYKPYDIRVLHCMAISCFNLGRYKEALRYWDKIARLDPQNTVSDFYKKLTKNCIHDNKKAKELPYHFQVPYDEIIRRVKNLNDMLQLTEIDLLKKWENHEGFYSLLNWGLDLNDKPIKKAILNVVASFGDEKAEEFLRKFLLRKGEEELKKEALGLLKQINASEPYIAYVDDNIVEVKVDILEELEFRMPVNMEKVLVVALDKMKDRYKKGYEKDIRDIWTEFIRESFPDELPRIRKPEAWAAALEIYYCEEQGIDVKKGDIVDYYGITYTTLNNNYNKLLSVLD